MAYHQRQKILGVNQRIVIMAVFLVLCFFAIIYRLFSLQIIHGQEYADISETQYQSINTPETLRGDIKVYDKFDQQGYLVATNIHKDLIFADPRMVKDIDQTASALSGVLGMQVKDIVPKLQSSQQRFVVIKRQVTPEETTAVKKLGLTGVGVTSEVVRFYPEKDFLSQVLGFLGYKGNERVGSYGVESALNSQLQGDNNTRKGGSGVVLTIDRSIQKKVETVLEATVTTNLAESGSIVVMDPKTGRILAMATYPSFDPNEYNKISDQKVFLNQTTQVTYEPGSIMKPLTLAAAINEGKLKSDDTYVDTGSVKVDDYVIKNSDDKAHGRVSMTTVLEESLNTGAIFAKDKIGNITFYDYLKKFGFGDNSGIEVDDVPGNLSSLTGTYKIKVNYDTASFGQGITVTPLQMVKSYSALANNGKEVTPYIVDKIVLPSGEEQATIPPEPKDILKPEVVKEVTDMLVSVVDHGHGKKAAIPGYSVAGKTGTAQIAKAASKGYEENSNIGSFIGYAPAHEPKFVILVRIDRPKTVKFAESTAAPAFAEVGKYLLDYYGVKPDR